MTKMQEHFYYSYKRSNDTELADVYASCSDAKRRAYRYCYNLFLEQNAWGFKIISHTAQFFTVGWLFDNNDGETCLHVETHANTYEFPVD